MKSAPHIPAATYRLQFNHEFTFRQATELIPYLSALGITHVYASPYLRARPGSMHGYDIIDHNSLNPEIGTPEEYEQFVETLHTHGMGQILDIVPNHMGVIGSDNAWWLDVLENGQASPYADFFDIDWDPLKKELHGKVLIPILEDQYGKVLESGGLKLAVDSERGEFSLNYYQHRFPIAPREYPRILTTGIEELRARRGSEHDDVLELQSIATAFSHLPERGNHEPEKLEERNREKEVQKRRLATLCARSPEILQFLEQNIQLLNGTEGDSRSFDALHELIKAQAYRLAQWRVAADDINYRRFFDINDLAALRQENETVFPATHRFILDLVAQGKVNGLRIDHPDGLHDPAAYFRALQSNMAQRTDPSTTSPGYVLIEKILTGDEPLRKEWPVSGTTGYEFANLVNGLFVDTTAASEMERIYKRFIGLEIDLKYLTYYCKKLILKISLASELNVLANALSRIALSDRRTCDFTVNSLRSALAEIIACFPVYRTYVSSSQVTAEDRQYIQHAVAAGRRRSRAGDLSIFDFVHRMMVPEFTGEEPANYRRRVLKFAMKFQQVSSAVMAKGLEDTAFYRYNRLVSLNEVGGDPGRFGVSVEDFHQANLLRQRSWPSSMLATSTHDSKRAEDVRQRINVLSELPALWTLALRRWKEWNRGKKRIIDGELAPSKNDEYLLYQTLVGAWPTGSLDGEAWQKFRERIEQYMLKAIREAKDFTSWANENADYENATVAFIRAILDRGKKNKFLHDFAELHPRISRIAMFNSLSQTLLKLTCPGVPDIYQGTDLWDFSLVDPDNRRPVDYKIRREMLRNLQSWIFGETTDLTIQARDLLKTLEDGRIKLFVTMKTLNARKAHHDLFQKGDYSPLTANGPKSLHICAFARKHENQAAIVVVPRRIVGLLDRDKQNLMDPTAWTDTVIELSPELRNMKFRNIFTNESFDTHREKSLPISLLLSNFPVAMLIAE